MYLELHDLITRRVADDQHYMGLATFKDSNGSVNIQLELRLRGDGEPHAQVDADDYIDKVLSVKKEEDIDKMLSVKKERNAGGADYRFTVGTDDAEQEIFTRVHHELEEEHRESEFDLSAFADVHVSEFGVIVDMLGHNAVRSTVFAAEDFASTRALDDAKTTVWTATVQPLSERANSTKKTF